jgi:hypothetical protein
MVNELMALVIPAGVFNESDLLSGNHRRAAPAPASQSERLTASGWIVLLLGGAGRPVAP